jgi:lipid A 4'-phosphatase
VRKEVKIILKLSLVLLSLLGVVTYGYFSTDIDLAVANYFYDHESGTFPSNIFFDLVTTWGVLPAQIVGVVAAMVLCLSYVSRTWASCRKAALLCVLPMALGAGLIVHPLLKDHWGRPRPRQVDVLGGTESYRPFYNPNFTWQSHHKSFPCGHCTMGFYFLAFIPLGYRLKRPNIGYVGWILAALLGISLSLARIAQGGHFFSDTLFTALIMTLVTWASDRIIFGPVSRLQVPCMA